MRTANHQLFCLLLVAVGASLLSISSPMEPYAELLKLQTTLSGFNHSPVTDRLHAITNFGWALRAGGIFILVLGLGGLVIPWVNALVYRRQEVVQFVD